MKNSIFLLSIAFFSFIILSCKKDDTVIDKNSIKLIVLEPTATPPANAGGDYEYKLRGVIVAPGALDIKNHGFVVTDIYDKVQKIEIGSGKKMGSVESAFKTYLEPAYFTIRMFVLLENGDTITNDGEPLSTEETPPINTSELDHYVDGSDEVFTFMITNLDNTNYTVIDYGIQYQTMSAYTANGQVFSTEGGTSAGAASSNDNFINASARLTPTSFPPLTPNEYYVYRTYVVATSSATGPRNFEGTEIKSFQSLK